MKTYFIDKIEDKQVKFTATSIAELEKIAIRFRESNGGGSTRIYVHCAQVLIGNSTDRGERNVEYFVNIDNHKHTITTKRI